MKRAALLLGCGFFLLSCASHQTTTLDCDGYTGVTYRIYGGHIDERPDFSASEQDSDAKTLRYFCPTNPSGLSKKSYLIDVNVSIYYHGFLSIGGSTLLKDGLWADGYFVIAYGGDCSNKEASLSVLSEPILDRITIA